MQPKSAVILVVEDEVLIRMDVVDHLKAQAPKADISAF